MDARRKGWGMLAQHRRNFARLMKWHPEKRREPKLLLHFYRPTEPGSRLFFHRFSVALKYHKPAQL